MTLPAIALSAPAGATSPAGICPAADSDAGCGIVITVNADGSASPVTYQGPYDTSDDVLIGVVNNSDSYVSNIELSGSDIFGFDGDGICTVLGTGSGYCNSSQIAGDEGTGYPLGNDYEGSNNTFYESTTGNDYVVFNEPLAPGGVGNTYFSLEEAPSTVGPAGLDIVTASSTVTGVEGTSTGSVQVATFSDGLNVLPVHDFTAMTSWGDGSLTSPSSSNVTQPGGIGTSYLVTDTHTYTEEGSYETTVTVEQNSYPYGSGNGTATISDAALSAPTDIQPAIPDATTGKSFTAPVAAFTDANPFATAADFTASINWGDGHITAGKVKESGSTFEVSDSNVGLHSYAAYGTYEITVMVTDDGGSTVTTPPNPVTDYDAVINCSSSCSGSASNTQQSNAASSSSTEGMILLDLNDTPSGGPFSCGDPLRHAPEYSFITSSGLTPSGSIALTVGFANDLAAGPWWDPFAVCYDSPGVPFTTLLGQSKTLGLLPFCPLPRPGHPVVGPCVQSIRYSTIIPLPSEKGTVTEQLILPPNDPFSH